MLKSILCICHAVLAIGLINYGFALEFEVASYSVWIDLYVDSTGIEVSGFSITR
jgi:hypothetical protein